MNIPREVQVEFFHGDDLGVAAASSAALDAKGWPLRWLADAGDHTFAQVSAKRLAEPDGGGGFAFSEWCGSYGGDIYLFAIRNVMKTL